MAAGVPIPLPQCAFLGHAIKFAGSSGKAQSAATVSTRKRPTTYLKSGKNSSENEGLLTRRTCLRSILGITSLTLMSSEKDGANSQRRKIWPPPYMRKAFARGMATGMADYEAAISSRKRRLFSSCLAPGQTVLDLGIGAGPNMAYLPSGTKCTGLDPNEFMAPYAYRTAEQQVPRGIQLTIVDGKAESIPFPDATFDAVIR